MAHKKAGAIKYGQSQLDISDEMDVEHDRARYEADRAKDIALGGTHGIDEVMKAQRLDALLFPGRERRRDRGQARLSDRDRAVRVGAERADAGRFRRASTRKPAPFGVSFTGGACSEPRLLELAYAFEQATKRRVPPLRPLMSSTRRRTAAVALAGPSFFTTETDTEITENSYCLLRFLQSSVVVPLVARPSRGRLSLP